ncbi:metallophosphoesterase family protein [Methylobacterium frigidaeris]|uniref:Bis(5'-nucleosyl)-tetraphosphatase, symmetrical n=1 Tax=Methylobacterium frigidaeris TaxID=2038277 RepID=A0AA37HAF3_9HYPH|nr:metallophosphoesterase family protein [Methylobacterium frigidaeris]PIK70141.1 serine/threonine protein phosphatase [Methylobacterium frigidaeris]GJD62234.1 Bis(5'-nucleosyl)-tetraphosphatase, symmetrical [Methylobacterium frigidaeris]
MDQLTYAIGDVHGCAGALENLLDQIDAHGAGRRRQLVFLGDYIDKGPESARAVAVIRQVQERDPDAVVCLMGNREAALLQAVHDPRRAAAWLATGGDRTLSSYGVARVADLPADALAWIAGLKTVHEDALRYYVHAGFRPGRRGIDPSVMARLWIREPFLSVDFDFGKHVVHGHTPCYAGLPDRHPYRTNLDTAPVRTGRLTAAVFTRTDPGPVAFLQSRPG